MRVTLVYKAADGATEKRFFRNGRAAAEAMIALVTSGEARFFVDLIGSNNAIREYNRVTRKHYGN